MTASDFVRYISDAVFVAIFVFVAARAIRHPSRAAIDTVLFFGVVSFVVIEQVLSQALGFAGNQLWMSTSAALVMSLPYWLLRLVDDFAGVPRVVMMFALATLLAIVVVLFVVTPLTRVDTLVLVAYFAILSIYCAVAFARVAARATGVNRRRLRSISFGTYVLGLLILLAGVGAAAPDINGAVSVVVQLLALVWGLAYAAGFAPPDFLRRLWQEPELRGFLARAATLPRLPTTAEIVAELEAGAAAATGASAQVALADANDVMYFRQARSPEPFPVGPGSTLPARRAYDEQRPVFYEDLARQDPANIATYRGRLVSSVIIAPITAGERKLGVLMVLAPRAPLFAEDDVTLVKLLADQAAVILESRALIDEATALRAQEQATHLKEDFLSSAAHDLKTPLTTLVAQTQYLEHRARRDPKAPADLEGLARISREAKRLRVFVDELLDASRLDLGRLTIHRERADLVELAREVTARERPADHGVVLEAHGPVVGDFDAVRIVQLLENLVDNAVKYSERGEPVRVIVERRDEKALITVCDKGIGIPPDDLPHVFDRFRRAGNVDDRRHVGIGLGLYISRGIVEQHGGAMRIESEVGRGTTVHIELPLRAAEPALSER